MSTKKHIRYSRQRERILELLKDTKEHPSADTVYRQMQESFPSISLGTVYRNLSLLHEQGFINRIMHEEGPDRFDADVLAHSHFYCNHCGNIYDIKEESDTKKHNLTIDGHKIIRQTTSYYGICLNCNKKSH